MKKYLDRLVSGATLTREETCDIMLNITREAYPSEQIASLLMALQVRGVTVDELLGLRDGLMQTRKAIDLGEGTIDIVGTGGDGKNTFNISTCSAFVVAGAGYRVTKHGNAASTSVSGASNVLEAHGVKFTDDADLLRRSLDEAGICYLHAPLFATGMKYVGPTRRAMGIPTCFNLLGPLVNPATPTYSLHGTATQAQLRLYANIHKAMGDEWGVVTSFDGYDEISLTGGFKYVTARREQVFTPEQLGLKAVRPQDIYGGETRAEAVKIFDSVLRGTSTDAQRDVVIANAACAIGVVRPEMSIEESIDQARESLASGRALRALQTYVAINS